MLTQEAGKSGEFAYTQRSGVYMIREPDGKHFKFMCATWVAVCTTDTTGKPLKCSDEREVLGCYRTKDLDKGKKSKELFPWEAKGGKKKGVLEFKPELCGMAINFA